MKTEKTEINSTLFVFATIKGEWDLLHLKDGELPYIYEIKSFDWGGENSVRLYEFDVMTTVPANIDITMKCIENLNEQIVRVEKESVSKVKDLEERIRAISLIEHKPDLEIVS